MTLPVLYSRNIRIDYPLRVADNARHHRKGVKMCKFLMDCLDLEDLDRDEKDKLKTYFERRKEELQEQIRNLDRAIDAVKR
jgi:hypothetical protein